LHERRLAAESLARGDLAGWFERLYAQASSGAEPVISVTFAGGRRRDRRGSNVHAE